MRALAVILMLQVGCVTSLSEMQVETYTTGTGINASCFKDFLTPFILDSAVRQVAWTIEGFGLAKFEEVLTVAQGLPLFCGLKEAQPSAGEYWPSSNIVYVYIAPGETACEVSTLFAHEFIHAVAEHVLLHGTHQQAYHMSPLLWSKGPAKRTVESTVTHQIMEGCTR